MIKTKYPVECLARFTVVSIEAKWTDALVANLSVHTRAAVHTRVGIAGL